MEASGDGLPISLKASQRRPYESVGWETFLLGGKAHAYCSTSVTMRAYGEVENSACRNQDIVHLATESSERDPTPAIKWL
jgi:hypothetical protein